MSSSMKYDLVKCIVYFWGIKIYLSLIMSPFLIMMMLMMMIVVCGIRSQPYQICRKCKA